MPNRNEELKNCDDDRMPGLAALNASLGKLYQSLQDHAEREAAIERQCAEQAADIKQKEKQCLAQRVDVSRFHQERRELETKITALGGGNDAKAMKSEAYNRLSERLGRLYQQQADLNRRTESVEQNMHRIREDRRVIEERIDTLQRQISGRHLPERLCKWVFGDDEKKDLNALHPRKRALEHELASASAGLTNLKTEQEGLQGELSAKQEEIRQVQDDIRELEAQERRTLETLRAEMELSRDRERAFVAEWETRKAEDAAGIRRSLLEENEKRNEKLREERERWIPLQNCLLVDLEKVGRQIREEQPLLEHPVDLKVSSGVVPQGLAVDTIRLEHPDWTLSLPRLVRFPPSYAMLADGAMEENLRFTHLLLMRMMATFPAGLLEIFAADPLEMGRQMGPFREMLGKPGPFESLPGIWTQSDEIQKGLTALHAELSTRVQQRMRGEEQSWERYNLAHPDHPLPYIVLLLMDVPENLSGASQQMLLRLVELGPVHGLLPILFLTSRETDARIMAKLEPALKEHCRPLPRALSQRFQTLPGVQTRLMPESLPDLQSIRHCFAQISCAYEAKRKQTHALTEFFGAHTLWTGNSRDGLSAPIGWDEEGAEVRFELGWAGSTCNHALICGRTGAGKSNLIHVILHSFCHHYGPEALRVYLLDFKEGIEMNAYAHPELPHANLIATEGDVEYGLTVLSHLEAEMTRRAHFCKQHQAKDLASLPAGTQEAPSRMLVVIDEFQSLFADGKSQSMQAENLMMNLLRKGRAFGIHFVLCTQSLSGMNTVSLHGLTAQIGLRICLACDANDSAKVLAPNNDAGARLHGAPEAILNSRNGDPAANRFFRFPLAEPERCKSHLEKLHALAGRNGILHRVRIFRGDLPEPMPSPDAFSQLHGTGDSPCWTPGVRRDFDAEPLTVAFSKRPGAHLLAVTPTPQVRSGWLTSLLMGADRPFALRHLAVYSPLGNAAEWEKLAALRPEMELTLFAEDWTGDFSQLPPLPGTEWGLLVLDGLEHDRLFKPGPFRARAEAGTGSGLPALMHWLDESPRNGWRTMALAENWRSLDTADRRDFLPKFQLRLGADLQEDDAGKLLFSTQRTVSGLQGESRAVYFDQLRNHTVYFRPYLNQEEACDE